MPVGDSVAVAEEAANGGSARLRVRYPRTMSGSSNRGGLSNARDPWAVYVATVVLLRNWAVAVISELARPGGSPNRDSAANISPVHLGPRGVRHPCQLLSELDCPATQMMNNTNHP